MTYRVCLIWTQADGNGSCTATVERERVQMHEMKASILDLMAKHNVPVTGTVHVEQEDPRQVYFRNLLSSLSFTREAVL